VIGDDAAALAGLTQADVARLLGDADVDDADETVSTDSPGAPSPRDKLATAKAVASPEYYTLVDDVKRWLVTTRRLESDLAVLVDLPPAYVARLVRGEPFPCSRAVATRIRARLESW